jgi:hypothetical protein
LPYHLLIQVTVQQGQGGAYQPSGKCQPVLLGTNKENLEDKKINVVKVTVLKMTRKV